MDSRLFASEDWGIKVFDKRHLDFFNKLVNSTEYSASFDFINLDQRTYNFKSFGGTPNIFVQGLSKVVYVYLEDYLDKMTDDDLKLFNVLGRHPGCLKGIQLKVTNQNKVIPSLMPLVTFMAYMAPVDVEAFCKMTLAYDYYTGSSYEKNELFTPSESVLLHLHAMLKVKNSQHDLNLSIAERLIVDVEHNNYHRILATASIKSEDGIKRYTKKYLASNFSRAPEYQNYFRHIFRN